MTTRPDNPGVWFPPPLLYASAVLVGLLLERRWPLPIPKGLVTIFVGAVFVAAGIVLAIVSVGGFRRSKTSIIPIRGAAALVAAGPYRYTRNPMYVSLTLVTIACGLFLKTWWPIILLVPTLALVHQFVILPEERYLQRRFGDDYVAYKRSVRRWL